MNSFFKDYVFCATLSLLFSFNVAADQAQEPAIIVIGASLSSGDLPLNDAGQGVLGGISIGLGSYLNLGHALIKNSQLPGYVINEAQAGATTFDRTHCTPEGECYENLWLSFDHQLDRALARVGVPGVPGVYNAKYVVITLSNDCLHANAFGIPQEEAVPCTFDEFQASVDRQIALGQRILNLGMTPIFDEAMSIEKLDLATAGAVSGLLWMMDDASYVELNTLRSQRIRAELPGAVLLNIWGGEFETIDGIHPTDKSARKAATVIAKFVTN